MSTIYFIRHGQTAASEGDPERLTKVGLEQSKILGTYFVNAKIKLDAVYCGFQKRQMDSARIMMDQFADAGAEVPIRYWAEFNEYDTNKIISSLALEEVGEFSDLEELSEKMLKEPRLYQLVFELVLRRWITGHYEDLDLETWAGFTDRVRTGINRLITDNGPGKTLAIVSSTGPLAALVQRSLFLSEEMTIRVHCQIRNASLSTFLYNEQQLTLSTFNSTSHLEVTGQKNLLTFH